jgi:subfamily B ATP-binding cassette protein MsbA
VHSPSRRLLSRFRPYAARLLLALVLLAVGSAIPPAVVFLVRAVMQDLLVEHDPAALSLLPVAVVGLYLVNGGASVARAYLTRSIAWRVVTDMRQALHDHFLALDAGWHQRTPLGERLQRLNADCNQVQFAVSGIVTAIQEPLALAGLLASAFVLNPVLAAIAALVLPLAYLPIRALGRWSRRASRDALEAGAALSAVAQETLAGIRVVQLHGAEALRAARYREANEAHFRAQVAGVTAQIVPGPVVEVLAAVAVGAATYIGGRQVLAGTEEAGDVLAFLAAIALMNRPLKGIALVYSLWSRAVAASESVDSLLDMQPAVADAGRDGGGGGDLAAAGTMQPRHLEIRGVSFSYGESVVLHDLTLGIRPGERVALVGASGAGKSTLLSLLARLRDPGAGAITWDGVDLRDMPLRQWRRHLAVVTQEPFLFDDTVAANIRLGRPGASDEEVRVAAIAANADAFIRALPGGYAARVDELGLRLSGGERQRLCIARAFLRGAPLLLLDEPTSNLDAESEAGVVEGLEALCRGRTVVLVAHRLSTVRNVDRVVVLDQGRRVEEGTHEDLLARGGAYARLYARQA